MKTVAGTTSDAPLRDDADESCLCQGEVPDELKVYLQQLVYDEKKQKERWKSVLRFHIDCPLHGVRIT